MGADVAGDDANAVTSTVYARAVFTVPEGRNNTLFRFEFADHADERPHPPFQIIFREGAGADQPGALASRAVTTPYFDAGTLHIVGSAMGLNAGQVYTVIVRDAQGGHDAAYAPQTYRVTSVSAA